MPALVTWPLLALALFAFCLWVAIAHRVFWMLSDRPTIRRGLDLLPFAGDDGPPKVTIIVPAHNEERVIDACCTALRRQEYDALEIVFVLDRCTDGTLDIVRRHADEDDRVVIVENDACPDDWAGKCHAAKLGADVATGDFLLFTDADTEFDPRLVAASVAIARDRNLGLVSILSTLTFGHTWERIAQPVASMHLIRLFPIHRASRAEQENRRAFANGQFLLFSREWYDRIGGHESVRGDLLEDIALARRIHLEHGHAGVFIADGLLRCSMYESLNDFRLGWKRIFIEACNRRPPRLRRNAARIMFTGIACPIAQAAALALGISYLVDGQLIGGIPLTTVAAAGLIVQAAALVPIYFFTGAPARAIIGFPIGSWIVARIMLDGAGDLTHRRPIPWAGREYVLEPKVD
ncbi:MAG: glycosyltransferase [Planctomycetes bacterium]|nr:glycosyltransferase [Planctomycetota bacterium]